MPPTETALRRFLSLARKASLSGRVLTTAKADDELEAMGWERGDLLLQLAALGEEDFLRVERSRHDDAVAIWVFCPPAWEGGYLWLRLAGQGREAVLVISIHPSRGDPWRP